MLKGNEEVAAERRVGGRLRERGEAGREGGTKAFFQRRKTDSVLHRSGTLALFYHVPFYPALFRVEFSTASYFFPCFPSDTQEQERESLCSPADENDSGSRSPSRSRDEDDTQDQTNEERESLCSPAGDENNSGSRSSSRSKDEDVWFLCFMFQKEKRGRSSDFGQARSEDIEEVVVVGRRMKVERRTIVHKGGEVLLDGRWGSARELSNEEAQKDIDGDLSRSDAFLGHLTEDLHHRG